MADLNAQAGIDRDFIHQIRDQQYVIQIYLYDGKNKEVPIKFLFVDSFSIEENLMNFITKGWIVLHTDFEILERGAPAGKSDQPAIPSSYTFRTDGRNRIVFRIYPVNIKNQGSTNPETFDPKYWEIFYTFVIYDIEDLAVQDNHKKLRKYYFWEERLQKLTEKNIEYSTVYSAQQLAKKPFDVTASIPDSRKCVNPNQALKDILITASGNIPNISHFLNSNKNPNSTMGTGALGAPNDLHAYMSNIDNLNWDKGDPQNLINYTSPANNKAIDDVKYLLERCSASDGSPVFLQVGRYLDNSKWSLVSLSKLFQDSTNNQVERLFIEDGSDSPRPSVFRASTDTEGNYKNFTSSIASRILSYRFSPMTASDDVRITNAPIHNYDFNTGKFNILFKNNKAVDVVTKMEEVAKKGLYNFTQKQVPGSILLNLNQTKLKGISMYNNFVPQKFYPKNFSQLKMMRDAIFLNEAITFQAKGLTIRTPGKFIFIDRIASDGTINPFDDRFLGQWLVIKVAHLFTQQNYVTEVVAVKVDAFSTIFDKQDQFF